jgi:hypothetical protein
MQIRLCLPAFEDTGPPGELTRRSGLASATLRRGKLIALPNTHLPEMPFVSVLLHDIVRPFRWLRLNNEWCLA